ncbi:Protein split ends [Lucilia cuprina]|nr:Protein split ends [Lucilia cuprina]
MNRDPECGCCPPNSCDACVPQCSSEPYVRIRAERLLKPQLVCSTKNCNIFGTHDTNPMPEYPYRKKNNKFKDENKNSLGSPIGLVASNVNFKTEGKTSDIIQARYATYLKAFARLHLNAETSWNALVIDDIMKEGLILYSYSQKEESKIESPSEIYLPNEVQVLREFELSDFTFHIELMAPFKLNTSASSETGAKGDGVELTLEDLLPVLRRFFRQHKYGLLTVGAFYVLLWRSADAFFVFDACGRRITDFQTDKDKGVAMLICLSCLENVTHLIQNLSSLAMTEPLTLREIKVVKVVTPGGSIMQQDYGKRTPQYQVINDDYAYLKAGLHLSLNRRDLVRNRSALAVAVSAIVVSKIDHPATWDSKMLDKIICFGVNLCQACWANCRVSGIIDVTEFPTYFSMGQFKITNEIVSHKYDGTWRCVPGFKHSELAHAIRKGFEAGDQKLLVQINYQMYAVWKKHDFIYLLDPYRHRILGKTAESEVYEEMEKSATLRMFRSFEVFMNVFNNILLDSNRTSKFFIHSLKVKNIQKRHKFREAKTTQPMEDIKLDANGEIVSINENICFEEAEDLCQKALGEISDYEDEDLRSDVVEMELRTSSSEAEIMEEEEAGGAGEAEELEGLESSSSGEEGGGHKKKSQKGKGSSKGSQGKGGKGKAGKDKGGSGKGKKGKGAKDSEGGEGGGKKRKKSKNEENDESSGEEAGGKGKRSKKAKSMDKDKISKSKEGDQQETDKDGKAKDDKLKRTKEQQDDDKELKDKELKDKDLKAKDAKYNEQKGKDLKAKDQKDTDPKDKDLKDKDLKDKDLKDKDLKDKDLKDKNLKDKDLKDKDQKDKDLKDKDQKGKDSKDRDLKDKDRREKDLEDKDKNKAKDSRLKGEDDKNLKGKQGQEGKDEKQRQEGKDLNKTQSEKGESKDQSKDTQDSNKDQDKAKDTFGKDIHSNLTKDKTGLGKGDGDRTPSSFNKDRIVSNQDNITAAEDLNKSDKDPNKATNEGERNSQRTEATDDDKSKNIDDELRKRLEAAKGSNKENEMSKDSNNTQEKDQSKDKSQDESKLKDKLEPSKQTDKEKSGPKKPKARDSSRKYDDGTEADDENEDYFKRKQRYCSGPNPNRYPGYFKYPVDMAVVGSENGSYASICKLFQAGFKVADRVLTLTPWGNFVIFRCSGQGNLEQRNYYLFDGCTCNFDRFRHFDLSVGTAGLICFKHTHNVIEYIRHLRKSRRSHCEEQKKLTADDICRQYCGRGSSLRV